MAGQYRLTIEQGSTLNLVITWRDADNALVNLTGYKARLMVRASIEDSSPVLTLTTENGGISLGGAAGTITLTVSATDTAALSQLHPLTPGVYDLELVSGAGVVTRLLEGACVIKREVTR